MHELWTNGTLTFKCGIQKYIAKLYCSLLHDVVFRSFCPNIFCCRFGCSSDCRWIQNSQFFVPEFNFSHSAMHKRLRSFWFVTKASWAVPPPSSAKVIYSLISRNFFRQTLLATARKTPSSPGAADPRLAAARIIVFFFFFCPRLSSSGVETHLLYWLHKWRVLENEYLINAEYRALRHEEVGQWASEQWDTLLSGGLATCQRRQELSTVPTLPLQRSPPLRHFLAHQLAVHFSCQAFFWGVFLFPFFLACL